MAKKNPHAVALGRVGGRSRSPAKLAAIAKNAQLGGRKRKFAIGDSVRVKDVGAPRADQGQRGVIVDTVKRAVYEVRLDEDGRFVALYSWWLEKAR